VVWDFSDTDLNDSQVQAAMRAFKAPLWLIDQMRLLSRCVGEAAPEIDAPVPIVQGRRDGMVRTSQTRKLAARFPQPPRYLDLDSDHDLIAPENPVWSEGGGRVGRLCPGERVEYHF
jgi:hypothetical protein